MEKVKPIKPTTLDDLRHSDLELLFKAANTPSDVFFCYGKRYDLYQELNLLDEEDRPTFFCKSLLKHLTRSGLFSYGTN